jgi:hypothetical protein
MNIANILKYCPKGTRLYSTTYGEVILKEVSKYSSDLDYPIKAVDIKRGRIATFTKEGHFYKEYGECVLFPSKEQRDWRKFRLPIKRGDIMMSIAGTSPFIASGESSIDNNPKYICGITVAGNFKTDSNCFWTDEFYIPASKKIKKKLFKAIKEAGYNWNSKTLELEKIEKVKELEKIEKVKFKPFDKVLVRDNKNENWSASFFSHYIPSSLWPFRCFNVGYSYCIPYKGNEHLVGTNKDK